MYAMQDIVVDDQGTKLSYIDSGVPQHAADGYMTIFAVHGMAFTGCEWRHRYRLFSPIFM